MHSNRLRLSAAVLVILLAMPLAALAQNRLPATTASVQGQYAQLPLRRDAPSDGWMVQSLGWAAFLVVALAAAGFLIVRQKNRICRSWLRPSAKPYTPQLLGRTLLTPQCSLHVIEWNGEELLLGCTPQTVALLTRRPADPSRHVGGSRHEVNK
jgi:flagellar biogenesis protein FliO